MSIAKLLFYSYINIKLIFVIKFIEWNTLYYLINILNYKFFIKIDLEIFDKNTNYCVNKLN